MLMILKYLGEQDGVHPVRLHEELIQTVSRPGPAFAALRRQRPPSRRQPLQQRRQPPREPSAAAAPAQHRLCPSASAADLCERGAASVEGGGPPPRLAVLPRRVAREVPGEVGDAGAEGLQARAGGGVRHDSGPYVVVAAAVRDDEPAGEGDIAVAEGHSHNGKDQGGDTGAEDVPADELRRDGYLVGNIKTRGVRKVGKLESRWYCLAASLLPGCWQQVQKICQDAEKNIGANDLHGCET
jgi:hypothetical protein